MSKLDQAADLGQAIWVDYILRSFLATGGLQGLIDEGVRGVTSNPSIFNKALASSADYDRALGTLARKGRSRDEIYEALVLEDIEQAADLLRPVYEQTGGTDGFVSLEVSPGLADDTEGTVIEARRFARALNRPNVLIKVPATPAGVPAIEQLISEGINVNVTLIFSLAHYEAVAEAYITGLEKRLSEGHDLSHMASVASFFLSRVDSAVDRELESLETGELRGQIAIANAKVAYAQFKSLFSGPRWEKLAAHGARVQRPLWASTSTKNPAYPDTMYVEELIGPHTVNTVPPATLDAFRDHGAVQQSIESGLDEARARLTRLSDLGVDLAAITERLQREGVTLFVQAFEALMDTIETKRVQMLAGQQSIRLHLGGQAEMVENALDGLHDHEIIRRIWRQDHTVWKNEPTEITNRLGWLRIAEAMQKAVPELESLADEVRAAGYDQVLLLGMGGSSLAPEVLSKTFGPRKGYPGLSVLDSTDPDRIRSLTAKLDPRRTLFLVATKSGGTVETLSFFAFFHQWVSDAVGGERTGEHFVAITDPGSRLTAIAQRFGFRRTFLNDPNIGGRYSALSYFGLVPAALLGIDLRLLLERANLAACRFEECMTDRNNPGAVLGAALGSLAMSGRDKITFMIPDKLSSLGDWIEQLIAESTGKEGIGILPVVGETLGQPDQYGSDRVFVYLHLAEDDSFSLQVGALIEAGRPVVEVVLADIYDLGEQFFLWEMATAVASHLLSINPFDQPNVESAKGQARGMMATYDEEGSLPAYEAVPITDPAVEAFLDLARPGDYVALQAYVAPTDETGRLLGELRLALRRRTGLATTAGYGPRFLHSTGQLHKGDRGNGLFIQLLSEPQQDLEIPRVLEEAQAALGQVKQTFGVLKMAQALGDGKALQQEGRRVLRLHLGHDAADGIRRLLAHVQ